MNKWVSLTKPTKAYRLEKYRMAASLDGVLEVHGGAIPCLLYTSPSPRDATLSRMPSSA